MLLIQKSILRDATTVQSLQFCAKAGILVLQDIERDEMEIVAKTFGCQPIATIDQFTEQKLGHCDLVCMRVSKWD